MEGEIMMLQDIRINYSILRFIPSFVRNENIIVGLVIHVPSLNESLFYQTKTFKRVESFDDEMDRELFNADMKSFQEAFNFPLNNQKLQLSFFDFKDVSNNDFLDRRIEHYSNEYRFDKVKCIYSDEKSLENEKNNLINIFLPQDRPKYKRINTKSLKNTLKKVVKNGIPDINLNSNLDSYKDIFNEDKHVFDYEIEDTFYKVISFDYKKESYLVEQIKNDLFDIEQACRTFESNENMKITFIINDAYTENEKIFNVFERYIRSLTNVDIDILTINEFVNKKVVN